MIDLPTSNLPYFTYQYFKIKLYKGMGLWLANLDPLEKALSCRVYLRAESYALTLFVQAKCKPEYVWSMYQNRHAQIPCVPFFTHHSANAQQTQVQNS